MKKDSVTLHCGDCLDVLASLKPNSIDACVTDPPYGLEFMGKQWDSFAPRDRKNASVWDGRRQAQDGWKETAASRSGKGGGGPSYRSSHKGSPRCTICGKRKFSGTPCKCAEPQWVIEHRQEAPSAMLGFQAFMHEVATELYRVLKPGAHLLAFGGTRTYHRMACAIEDAGFEIRDCVQWIYGSGFPKSHDVSKGIDKAAGAKREVVGLNPNHRGESQARNQFTKNLGLDGSVTTPATAAARQWEGWGTALKPANEPIVLARKPLSEGTIAANVLRWGTGAINVDGCRVETQPRKTGTKAHGNDATGSRNTLVGSSLSRQQEWDAKDKGRWPANVIHDGSEEVVGAFPETASGLLATHHSRGNKTKSVYGKFGHNEQDQDFGGDSGSAARFFYCAKASKKDRAGSKHPTVKPIKLIRYLIRLITPPKGVVLDPFAGTGTTGEAAVLEGARAVLIEREREYIRDIRRRIGKPPVKRGRPIRRRLGPERYSNGRMTAKRAVLIKKPKKSRPVSPLDGIDVLASLTPARLVCN